MWALLRVWHVEALESVIDRPEAFFFTRTSYVTAPARWRELPQPELLGRVEQLLDAAYRFRAATLAGSEDPTRMLPFVFLYEWVERADAPASPDATAEPWVLPRANAHPALVEKAIAAIDAEVRAPRRGIDSRAYDDAFEVFRIDEDDSWHLVRFPDRAALFASRYT